MRTLTPLAFAAISGVVLWKLLATLLLPFLGMVFGFVGMVVKFALIVGVALFIYSMIKKRREEAQV